MKNPLIFSIILFLLWIPAICGEPGFMEKYHATNPVSPDSTYTFEEELTLHQNFLDSAIKNKNSLHQFYGYMYLSDDYVDVQDYSKAMEYLLKAEKFAIAAKNILWQGRVNLYKASLYTDLEDYEIALCFFEQSLFQAEMAADSQNVAMSMEQMGAMYNYLDNHEKAHEYYEKAIPLIKKYCGERSLGVTLSNYGILLGNEGKPLDALKYYKEALLTTPATKSTYRQSNYLSNIASAYFDLDSLDKALELWQECVKINSKNGWDDLLIINYGGLADAYEQKGDIKKALYFFKEHHYLHDSLMGMEVRGEINNLEAKYKNEQKETTLQKYKLELIETEQSLERSIGFLLLLLGLIGFIVWRWRSQIKFTKLSLAQSHESLREITYLLRKKNAQLEILEKEKISLLQKEEEKSPAKEENFDSQFYNQQILTSSDWELFKTNFEKAHPGYLLRLRSIHPTLSEAEERLFLFIKLHLNSKEIAEILGISIGGVKKTRYRLRKRLEINEGASLEDFIHSF
ncbi:MAG: tetratricopeptide repeat protein [Chitinophagales bacterium]